MQPPTDQLTSAPDVTDSQAASPVVCISVLLERRAKAVKRATAWAKAHPERRKEIENKYRKSEKAKRTKFEYYIRYYATHKDDFRRRKREWEKRNRKKCSQQVGRRLIRYRAELQSWYIRRLLSEGNSVPPSSWPVVLVEAKRAELKLKRIWLTPRTSKN